MQTNFAGGGHAVRSARHKLRARIAAVLLCAHAYSRAIGTFADKVRTI